MTTEMANLLVMSVTIFLVNFIVFGSCSANLNLFLSQAEVHRLLGLTRSELYYVREGVINDYAMNFVVPVPAHLSELHFSWQALTKRPLPYVLNLEVSNTEALPTPRLNISGNGMVPTHIQTFRVLLACSGVVSAEVDVLLSINVTLNHHSNNVTSLAFRRKKICLKGVPEQQYHPINNAVTVNAPLLTTSVNIYYIAIGSASALLLLIILVGAGFYARSRKSRRHRQGVILVDSRNGSATSQAGHTFLSVEVPNHYTSVSSSKSGSGSASYASFKRLPSYHISQSTLDDRARDVDDTIAELTLERCKIRLRSILHEGTFGRIYKGTFLEDDGLEVEVSIKTVTEHASHIQVGLLLEEGLSLYGLAHKNILSVFGVSVEEKAPPFLLYLNHEFTNLKRFLHQCKASPEGLAHNLTTQEIVSISLQIVQAMQFLLRRKVLHRDISTRNCVIDDKMRVKVTDNALSRDLFPNDYHCLGDSENRPVKWMSIEALLQRKYSEASDVWSFGVVLWELTTLATQPYIEIDPFEMATYLREGYRLAQPVNCPDELFAVMAYCWAMVPEERPTLSQLNSCLQDFYAQLTRYV